MKCKFALVFFLFFSVLSWAQEPPPALDTSSSLLPSEPVLTPTEPPPLSLSQQLKNLATTLEQATTDSKNDWELLSQAWTEHLNRLQELVTLSADSELEMQSIKASLKAYEKSLMDSIAREAAARRRERAWRCAAVGGIALGVAGAFIDPQGGRGALVGAALGAAGGYGWTLIVKP